MTRYKLAKLSRCTPSWVYMFLKELKNKGLIKDEKTIDYSNINYKGLFELWLGIYKRPNFREYMIRAPFDILKDTKLTYAMTTYFAENMIQSYLFPLRYDIYIKNEDLDKWHSILAGKGFYGKGNFRILISDDDAVFYKKGMFRLSIEEDTDFYMVSLPQIIVDLLYEGGPAKEAAYMLIEGHYQNV